MKAIITLTTDFGTRDPFVAAMKGVILDRLPSAVIVDISHHVPPGDIEAASTLLGEVCPLFPDATVHVCVVDPGVGSSRRGLAIRRGGTLYVGPDNGVFSPFLRGTVPVDIWELKNEGYFRRPLSSTFHGRDIFAPVAAGLADGLDPGRLGPAVDDPVLLEAHPPGRAGGRMWGRVDRVDRFGNLITNVPGGWLPRPGSAEAGALRLTIGRYRIEGLNRCYADRPPGHPGFLVGSTGCLEIFLNGGRAAESLRADRGDRVEIVSGPHMADGTDAASAGRAG